MAVPGHHREDDGEDRHDEVSAACGRMGRNAPSFPRCMPPEQGAASRGICRRGIITFFWKYPNRMKGYFQGHPQRFKFARFGDAGGETPPLRQDDGFCVRPRGVCGAKRSVRAGGETPPLRQDDGFGRRPRGLCAANFPCARGGEPALLAGLFGRRGPGPHAPRLRALPLGIPSFSLIDLWSRGDCFGRGTRGPRAA